MQFRIIILAIRDSNMLKEIKQIIRDVISIIKTNYQCFLIKRKIKELIDS